MGKIYDVSVPITDSTITYPGNPEIRIALQKSVARGDSSNVSSIAFGSHTGTHVDAPRHFFESGVPVDQLPLDRLMGLATVLEFPDQVKAIGRQDLEASGVAQLEAQYRQRILLKSGNSAFWARDREFRPDYTYLDPEGAEYLIQIGVQLVGIDYLSIEQFHSGHHRTHRTLLEKNIVIVEGLNLHGIAPGVYEFCCLPLRIEGCDGAPARAVLMEVS